MDGELRTYIARAKIIDCLARVARGEDRRDPALIRAGWWPDSTYDFGIQRGDFTSYLDWIVPGAAVIANTQHVLGQSHFEFAGPVAKVETHVLSYHRVDLGSGDRDLCIGGRYLDQMEERSGEWRIARRVLIYDWCNEWGASTDWSQGLMGSPITSDHSGRSEGDPSEIFFGKDRT